MVVTLVQVRERPDFAKFREPPPPSPEPPQLKPARAETPHFPDKEAAGISKTQQPAKPLPKPEPDIVDESPRELIPTTIFRNVDNFFCDFQIPIWSAWQPNTVILYRPRKTDNLQTIRELLQDSGDWYPGDHDVKVIRAANLEITYLDDWTAPVGVPVCMLLVPKGNIHVKIEVKQRNRYMDINYTKQLNIDVCLTEKVRDLKKKIETMTGFPIEQQDLLLKNRCLQNNRLLFDYEIRDKTSVKLIIQPRYTFKINVVAFWNKEYKLEIDRSMVIQDIVIGVIWQNFMERKSKQAKYVIGCLLKEDILKLEYEGQRLEMDKCLLYYQVPQNAKLRLRPKCDETLQDRTVTLQCEREEIKIKVSGTENWAMLALKSLVNLNLPLDQIKLQRGFEKLNFTREIGGKPGENIKVKLTVENMMEIKYWQQQTVLVKLPQGTVQMFRYTEKDTIRDLKLFIEHCGFRSAPNYHTMVGDVHLSNHMMLSELPLARDDYVELVPDDFALYLHLKQLRFAFIQEQGMQTLEGLHDRCVNIDNSDPSHRLIFTGHLIDHNDTYLYETHIAANCAIFKENDPDFLILKLRTETDPASVSMRCMLPSSAKKNAATAQNSKHLVPKSHTIFARFLDWRLEGINRIEGNSHILKRENDENIQRPGMKPLLHDLTDGEERSRFNHPEVMPGHLVIPAESDKKDKKKFAKRRRSAPEARNIGGHKSDYIPGLVTIREIRGEERHRRNQGTRDADFRMLTPTFRIVKIGLPRIAKFANRDKPILHNKRKFAVRNWKPKEYVAGTLVKRKGDASSIGTRHSSLPDINAKGKFLTGIEDLGPTVETVDVEVQADIAELDEEDFRRYKIMEPNDKTEPDQATQAWAKTLNTLIAQKKQESDQKSEQSKSNITAKKSIFSFFSILTKKKQEEEIEDVREPTPPWEIPPTGDEVEHKGRKVVARGTMTDVTLFIDEEWPSKNSVVNALTRKDILQLQKILPVDAVEEESRGPQDRPSTAERDDWHFTTYDDENKVKVVNYFDDPVWDEAQHVEHPEVTEAKDKVIIDEMREGLDDIAVNMNLNIDTVLDLEPPPEVKKRKREKACYKLVNQDGNPQQPVTITQAMKAEMQEEVLKGVQVESLEAIAEEGGSRGSQGQEGLPKQLTTVPEVEVTEAPDEGQGSKQQAKYSGTTRTGAEEGVKKPPGPKPSGGEPKRASGGAGRGGGRGSGRGARGSGGQRGSAGQRRASGGPVRASDRQTGEQRGSGKGQGQGRASGGQGQGQGNTDGGKAKAGGEGQADGGQGQARASGGQKASGGKGKTDPNRASAGPARASEGQAKQTGGRRASGKGQGSAKKQAPAGDESPRWKY